MATKISAKQRKSLLLTWIGPEPGELVSRLQNPSDPEIQHQLSSLPGGEQISCVQLFQSKQLHMDAAGSVSEGFYFQHVEYSDVGRWDCADNHITLEKAVQLLSSYANDDDRWREMIDWRRYDPTLVPDY